METVDANTRLGRMLVWCLEREASDLHGKEDHAFTFRSNGRLGTLPEPAFPPPDGAGLESLWSEAGS